MSFCCAEKLSLSTPNAKPACNCAPMCLSVCLRCVCVCDKYLEEHKQSAGVRLCRTVFDKCQQVLKF